MWFVVNQNRDMRWQMFDSHVHAAPDIISRRGDDAEIAREYGAAGYQGFVLKAHYESTVGRARAAAAASGLRVYGGIALNQHCGGINASAVAATLLSGGRVVWMPTADSHTQHAAGLPRLCHSDERLSNEHFAIPPVDTSKVGEIDLILELIAEHDAVLATGHISAKECRWLVERAFRAGVTRVLMTHPSYLVPKIGTQEIMEFAALGAFIEITAYQLLHQPDFGPAELAEVAVAAGHQLVLSSDAGQKDSPSPPDALQLLVETLISEGCDRHQMLSSASEVPFKLFTPLVT
jgi:hypothetical protein